MALKNCRECGANVSTGAKSCPQCGVSRPAGGLSFAKGFFLLLVIGFVGAMLTGNPPGRPSSNPPRASSREDIIRKELSYLLDKKFAPDIAWIDFDRNNAYIGFSRASNEMSLLIREAALRCNSAIDFGCHVWAVPASSTRPWRPGTGRYYEEVTARYGRIED